jgi:tetratricopeptide (TPR) repeat protein
VSDNTDSGSVSATDLDRVVAVLDAWPGRDMAVATLAKGLPDIPSAARVCEQLVAAGALSHTGLGRVRSSLPTPDTGEQPDQGLQDLRAVQRQFALDVIAVAAGINPFSRRFHPAFAHAHANGDIDPSAARRADHETRNILAVFNSLRERVPGLALGLAEAGWDPLRVARRWHVLAHLQDAGAELAAELGNPLRSVLCARRGFALNELGHREEARQSCDTAIDVALSTDDDWSAATGYDVRARIAIAAGEITTALADLYLAREHARRCDHPRMVALLERTRGDALARLDRHPEAITALTSARATFTGLGDTAQVGRVDRRLAHSHLALGDHQAALHAAATAIEASTACADPYATADAYRVAALVHRAEGDDKAAAAAENAATDLGCQEGP